MRNAFAKEITRLARSSSKLVLLSGDIGNRLFDEYKDIPNSNFLNCGVAEANMMGRIEFTNLRVEKDTANTPYSDYGGH